METIKQNNCVIKFKEEKRSDMFLSVNHFMTDTVFDICESNDTIIVISELVVEREERNKGVGSNELAKFCELHKDKIILFRAGNTKMYFAQEFLDEDHDRVLKEQSKFLIKNGFFDINNIIVANCEFENAFIYMNEPAELVLFHSKCRDISRRCINFDKCDELSINDKLLNIVIKSLFEKTFTIEDKKNVNSKILKCLDSIQANI